MSALSELIDGAVREDAVRLGGAGFATDRFGAVRGRVARRRAARSAGVGGASVLGVGVLAVGAAHVPWNGMVFGGPASSPSVACVTSTPDAVAGSALTVPAEALFALTDEATLAVYFVGWRDGYPVVWDQNGAEVEVWPVGDQAELTLESGTIVRFPDWPDLGSIPPVEGVTVTPIADFVGVETDPRLQTAPVEGFTLLSVSGVDWEVNQDGVTLATAHREGNTTTFTFADGAVKEYDLEGVRRLTVELPDGTEAIFRVDGAELTYEGSLVVQSEPAGQTATVTCVTTTPEPSASPSPSLSASPSVSPSASPSEIAAAAESPFYCGFEFASDRFGTDTLRVSGARTTASDIRATFSDWYGNQAPTTVVADSDSVAYRAALEQADVRGATSTFDPASPEAIQVSRDYDMPSLGFTFVAVSDGKVVGTVAPGSAGETPGVAVDSAGEGSPEEAFLWDLDALSPCGAVSIEGAQIYAVAGFGHDGDFAYSWMRLAE